MNNDLRIEAVETRRQRADFYRVKWELYRKDPAAVIPLKSMEWLQLDPQRHPFYQHARRQVWVAYRGSQPVGRVVGVVDDLHNSHYQDRVGFFGFFESPHDQVIANRLLETAVEWLRREGCESIRGPVSPSMKGEFGVLIEGHEHPPFIMMAHTPKYYDELLQSFGLAPVKRFHSFLNVHGADFAEAAERFAKLRESCEKIQIRFPEVSIRLGTPATLEQMLRDINRIGNVIRSRGWGFVPLTEAELDFNVQQLKRILDPQTVIGAFIDGKMVGYNVSIPNVNWAIQRSRGPADWIRFPQLLYWLRKIPEVRNIALGVDPNIRAKGITALVTKPMTDRWMRYQRWEFGWIAEDNLPSMAALSRAMPLHQYKTYQLYEKPI